MPATGTLSGGTWELLKARKTQLKDSGSQQVHVDSALATRGGDLHEDEGASETSSTSSWRSLCPSCGSVADWQSVLSRAAGPVPIPCLPVLGGLSDSLASFLK